jgi:uncharacterized membrane protein YeaQ/YmgE (transglycosylase-associated protein family)
MTNLIVYLIVGGVIGWLASVLLRTDAQQGTLMNIVVGILGAFIAGAVLSPVLGVGTINDSGFAMPALAVSLMGAIILLAIVNAFGRDGLRR